VEDDLEKTPLGSKAKADQERLEKVTRNLKRFCKTKLNLLPDCSKHFRRLSFKAKKLKFCYRITNLTDFRSSIGHHRNA
jgi:hypothetical protein